MKIGSKNFSPHAEIIFFNMLTIVVRNFPEIFGSEHPRTIVNEPCPTSWEWREVGSPPLAARPGKNLGGGRWPPLRSPPRREMFLGGEGGGPPSTRFPTGENFGGGEGGGPPPLAAPQGEFFWEGEGSGQCVFTQRVSDTHCFELL